MPRINVSITEEFKTAIAGYSTQRGISISAALVELAAAGYEQAGGKPVPAMREWGGDRKSEKYQQYLEWLRGVTVNGNDYDPTADQDGDYSFEAWLGKHCADNS